MKYTSASVRQLDRKGKKVWQARLKYKDATGKWKTTDRVIPEAKNKREANRLAKELMDTLNAEAAAMPVASGKAETVEEVISEFIKYQLERGEIEKSTYCNNLRTHKNYIIPYLGNYTFSTVDKTVINGWLTKLYRKGLAQSTIHSTYTQLKKIYNYFYENGELLINPFKGIKTPKRGTPKVTHLTDEQMDKVLNAVYFDYEPQNPMYIGILLAFYTGMRRCEICGLRWNDIDFNKHTITVRSSIGVAYNEFSAYTKNPKNKTSQRTFPMLPQIEAALKERYNAINPKNNWFVIGEKDEFMIPNTFGDRFHRFVVRNDLKDAYGKQVIPHGLRHNFATVGIRAGMDISSLALMMGHASRAMTLDTYGDANADALNLAAVKLTEKFDTSTSYSSEDLLEAAEEP